MPDSSTKIVTEKVDTPEATAAVETTYAESQHPPATTTSTSNGHSRSSRRSSRFAVASQLQDPVIAPGFGTAKDLQRLARDLSAGTGASLPVEAVQAMMESRGRGIRSSSTRRSADAASTEAAASTGATPVSSAWADFMQEEGMVAETTTTIVGKRNRGSGEQSTAAATTTASALSEASSSRVYNLDKLEQKTKKSKSGSVSGVLVQTGTLDSAAVGRSKKLDFDAPHCLTVPTRILPGVSIVAVHTAGHACHSIAISTTGVCYGWGRNENQQLGSSLGPNVYEPTVLEQLPGPVQSAATGKSHTLLLLQSGDVYAAGLNKVGQCGIKSSSIDQVANFRMCVFPEDMDSTIVQVACGEDFSVALCDSGYMYTTGSSEFGQLANGATGEHFITANKIAFANETAFTKRTTFCHAPAEKLYSNSDKSAKVVPFAEDIRIQQIACGKHHALALEADADDVFPRVFTWGCGDYGVLGHGVQADEYFPRCVGAMANMRLVLTGTSHLAISAGQHCSLLQTANGHIYYWGKHRSVGEATMRPTLVDALANNQHVVTQAAAGGQTVVCCTANAQTVAWGQGPHGELGLGAQQKSSAKPTFIAGLDSCRIASVACGYGHSLFVVRDDDKEDKTAVKKLPELDPTAFQSLADAAPAAPAPKAAKAKKVGGKKK